jgi:hypothetical protein
MFASMWKLVVRRWRHPGELREATMGGQARQRNQGSGQPDAASASTRRGHRASTPKRERASSPSGLRVAQGHLAKGEAAAARPRMRSVSRKLQRTPRPMAGPQSPRRTPPARHVWLEARSPINAHASRTSRPANPDPKKAIGPRKGPDACLTDQDDQ